MKYFRLRLLKIVSVIRRETKKLSLTYCVKSDANVDLVMHNNWNVYKEHTC